MTTTSKLPLLAKNNKNKTKVSMTPISPIRPDGVFDAPGDVASQGLAPWRHHGGGGTLG